MRLATAIAEGLVGGASGAGCMTVLRMAARRAGWIDLTPPEATKDWLAQRTGGVPAGTGAQQLLDAGVHLAVGVAGGAVYGAVARDTRRAGLASGTLFGLGVWAVAFGLVAPALRITRSPLASTWPENATNVIAHCVYGLATALVTGELGREAESPDAPLRRLRRRVG
jgi:uncharacterized membrane protein YagU involved in acid resistance